MRKLFFICCFLLGLSANAQTSQEPIYYRYIIAEPQENLFSDKCKLRIDDGIKPAKEKSKKGQTITFNSYAAALMYLTLQGWELISSYNDVHGSSGITHTNNYWILRRPSTKEEVQSIIDKSLIEEE